MKKSKDWLRPNVVAGMMEGLVKSGQWKPGDCIVDAARLLGVGPNGGFYKNAKLWVAASAERDAPPALEVPPEVRTAFQGLFDRFTTDGMNTLLGAFRDTVNTIHRDASLRIATAEERLSRSETEADMLTDHWIEAEKERDAARTQSDQLRAQLDDARRREDRLLGRLEQLSIQSDKPAITKVGKVDLDAGDQPPAAIKRNDGSDEEHNDREPVADTDAAHRICSEQLETIEGSQSSRAVSTDDAEPDAMPMSEIWSGGSVDEQGNMES
ncbi:MULTISPECIES: hypothetical protein [unclassified Sphingomonas]|uniref:hypothetical protein n=1 Tax=unclassified Sphingomonas TaxID=196159 RepID=UPI00285684CD|nr:MULTISPECIES: hypothetical protein [unclassified Sphingomonas]MDR6115811.1 hypothetical protein [Sphingomonas sp. SORGH_AS_0789]MDR6150518.1 hypothetical protein [Sphingomonas sp. SORGH_AS_0742]